MKVYCLSKSPGDSDPIYSEVSSSCLLKYTSKQIYRMWVIII
jgi:hypothetical protein